MASILVTGANRGIGLSLTKQLAARGDRVVAVCRTSSPELASIANVQVEAGFDMKDDAIVARLRERLGDRTFDGLVLNAGILHADALEGLSLDSLREQFEVNALGPLRAVSGLKKTLVRGSKVALITSRMGSIGDNGSGGYYGYRMSKAALNAAGKSLARDLEPEGIAVAILHPGYVKTEMTGNAGGISPDEAASQLLARYDALTLETSGRFLHANGEVLPW